MGERAAGALPRVGRPGPFWRPPGPSRERETSRRRSQDLVPESGRTKRALAAYIPKYPEPERTHAGLGSSLSLKKKKLAIMLLIRSA